MIRIYIITILLFSLYSPGICQTDTSGSLQNNIIFLIVDKTVYNDTFKYTKSEEGYIMEIGTLYPVKTDTLIIENEESYIHTFLFGFKNLDRNGSYSKAYISFSLKNENDEYFTPYNEIKVYEGYDLDFLVGEMSCGYSEIGMASIDELGYESDLANRIIMEYQSNHLDVYVVTVFDYKYTKPYIQDLKLGFLRDF